ncbi:unnamed protein product [Paramecium pentaurelia]|uniref:Uncharacterized protein n=1 Tax=Paramecium pentaurelia TaxID=43138 RepID=A0A8S1UMH5_9CILI|nr:unnamed protein product [Paramecium pentaurelia]
MGNSGSQDQRYIKSKIDQIIKRAHRIKRKIQSSGSSGWGPIKHVGILVETDENQTYIIHHQGPDGDVVSERCENYRNQGWEQVEQIHVNSHLTIGQAENIGGKGKGYLRNLTCIGVADKIQSALQSG